ncbi:MAG TPA: BamA/TamA family outer membrane protein, partial [Desulfobacteraceae bacterium]|nr:BamA/TamA family outer membrane protein [Desulfobacteraceae bacterium]
LDRFLKYRLDIRKYYSPFQRITFAFLSRMGYIDPIGSSETVAEDHLFFLGGISDVRGFKENMLMYDADGDTSGGLSSVAASMEARIDLAAGFELTLFVDTGRIDDTLSNTLADGFRTSVGTGLRYMTPIGPVGLLYGRKIDPRDGESSGRFHFAIGYTF